MHCNCLWQEHRKRDTDIKLSYLWQLINQIVCETKDFFVNVFICHTSFSLVYGESCEKCWSWFICAPHWFKFARISFFFGLCKLIMSLLKVGVPKKGRMTPRLL